jgi:LmbE family N-acetylglucosaminyl deacetylase
MLDRGWFLTLVAGIAVVTGEASAAPEPPPPGPACPALVATPAQPLEDVTCANDQLLGFDGLLVLAPHPDDESLAFAGLIDAYRRQGKPASVVIVTDGDAYCEACRFWKSASMAGPTCSAADLSNFGTTQVDSFAEVRRGESAAAASILGGEAPEFLGYPDTGVAAAWERLEKGDLDAHLRRSDFSQCASCEDCGSGYGAGPETTLTPQALLDDLSQRMTSSTPRTLVVTSHWLDGHADHAALGHFVRRINAGLSPPRPTAFAVIHAHTPKATAYPDCWYPGPAAPLCACALEQCTREDPAWVSTSRGFRFHPTWPASPPDDADYGAPLQLCLAQDLVEGPHPRKLLAVEAYRSQLGFLAREGALPAPLAGILDCSGYLIAFVRRTEVFYLLDPSSEPR